MLDNICHKRPYPQGYNKGLAHLKDISEALPTKTLQKRRKSKYVWG